MVQTFIIRGWLDNHEWGDEPPDPDDVWTEGDRVRLKNSTAEGTVQAQSSQPFLGSYLPYVQILWDGKKLPVPIDPSLLVRLSRTLPDEITWQAPQGFSDFKELLAVPFTQEKIMAKTITPSLEHDDIDEEEFYLAQTAGVELESVNSEQLTVDSEQDKPSIVNCQLSTDNCKFKPGDMVYVKKGNKRIKRTVGDRIGTGKNSAKILTLGGRSGKEEYWELPAKLELCQLTIETALLQDDELLSILDEQAFTSTVTITLRLKNRYEEQQISAVLAQLEEQGKVEKTICGDGKTFAWRKSAQKQQDQDLLNKVFGAVLSEDGVGDWDIVKLLEYEFALIEVQRALKHLESEGKVIKSSLGGGFVWRKNVNNQVFTVSSPESDSNFNKLNSSECGLDNDRISDLLELRSGIPLTQHKPEVLQSEMQVGTPDDINRFRESDRSVRVGNDSGASGTTIGGESEGHLQHLQESQLQVPNSDKQGRTKKNKSKSVSEQLLEGRDDYQGRIHNGEVSGSSQSQALGGVRSTAYPGDGKIPGEISDLSQVGSQGQRGSSPHQSRQTRQPDRKLATNEGLGAFGTSQQREQVQLEQANQESGHGRNLSISDRSCTESGSSQRIDFTVSEKENQSGGNSLGICLNSQSSTFVAEWDSGMPPQLSSLENTLNSSDSAKLTTTAETSSLSDTPTFQLSETSEIEKRLQELEQESCLERCHANPFQSPENGKGQKMSEISSPTSSTSLTTSDQTTLPSRTFLESSTAPTNQEEIPADFLNGFSGNFTSGGTMYNGKLSEAPTLPLPSLEKDLFWLRSPQALSSTSETSRPPGQSKLEVQLKELGLIGKDQVINPEFLARGLYNLPANWASLSESRAASEILGTSAKPTEIALIQESLLPHSITSPELNKQELQQSLSSNQGNLQLEPVPFTQQQSPVPFTQQKEKVTECFIQNDPSSFEWQGVGYYWLYPESIETDLGTQCRVETDGDTVKYYSTQMKDDLWEWEASIVGLIWDGNQFLPYDGHHRLKAAATAGKMILARVEEGDLQKAIALSCGSNKKPSLRRTREDNQKTIQMLEDVRAANGDEWLLNIINAGLPVDKYFKEVSLRAIEFYTGIPFKTIANIRNRAKSPTTEKLPKVSFTPTEEEMNLIQNIMDAEGFETPGSVFKWLLEEYKNQSTVNSDQ